MVNNRDQISHLIAVLTRDFVNSRSPHAKKGGLIGLASVAIGLRDVRMPTHIALGVVIIVSWLMKLES